MSWELHVKLFTKTCTITIQTRRNAFGNGLSTAIRYYNEMV